MQDLGGYFGSNVIQYQDQKLKPGKCPMQVDFLKADTSNGCLYHNTYVKKNYAKPETTW